MRAVMTQTPELDFPRLGRHRALQTLSGKSHFAGVIYKNKKKRVPTATRRFSSSTPRFGKGRIAEKRQGSKEVGGKLKAHR